MINYLISKKITTIVGFTFLAILPSISIFKVPAHASTVLASSDTVFLNFSGGLLRPINVEVKIKLVESGNINKFISNQPVSVKSRPNINCFTSPCFDKEEWIGQTNNRGELSIPSGVIFDLTTITVKGFQPKELSRKEFEQPKSNDRHGTQNARLNILLYPE